MITMRNILNKYKMIKRSQSIIVMLLCFSFNISQAQIGNDTKSSESSRGFYAIGPTQPVVEYLEVPGWPVPRELKNVAVEVYFDLVPTKMRFCLPCYPCLVTENNIHFSNGWTETYDPKASSSCEVLWDRDMRYARMWIESQNPARIILRVRAALCDPDGYIAHYDIPSGSPYGKGDWTDEWYYIYPDGTHVRHVRIYTGLAGQSLTVTDETFQDIPPVREIPPSVVHEFQEDFIFGLDGHLPGNDIETKPITLIKQDGSSKTISYKPYPNEFGGFAKANIKVINLKSEYKPFTIFMPYGVENEPYPPEGELQHTFQTWLRDPGQGYSTSLGHTLNWWHFRRNENILEQVYLSGMTNSEALSEELTALEQSWITYPRLLMDGLNDPYNENTYDQAQRAYIISGNHMGARKLEFKLGFENEDDEAPVKVSIVNPAFIIQNWGNSGVEIKVNDKSLEVGKDCRVGYEETHTGTDLILWLKMKSDKAVTFSLSPTNK
jgi:hypothetical protein